MSKDPFYQTRTWKHLRRVKLISDPICEYCGRKPASSVDHVTAISHGGHRTDLDNLKSCCQECHSRKTYYIERLGRTKVPIKGCDNSGIPLDPDHFWNKAYQGKGQGEIVAPGPIKRAPRGLLEEDICYI